MSLASYLRKLAQNGQYGHSRTPRGYYMGENYCTFYWHNHGICPDHPTWERVARLSKRYLRFVRYCEEVKPQWQDVREIHWADNSVDVVQRAADGRERTIQKLAPGGDACF